MANDYSQPQIPFNTDPAYRYNKPSSPMPSYPSRFPPCLPTSSTRYQIISPSDSSPSPSTDFSQPGFCFSPQSDNSLDPYQPSYRFPEDTSPIISAENTHMPTLKKSTIHQGVAHPYARIYAKKDSAKRHRKIWNHALEKSLFNSHEL
jgi:hypothetical protein